MARVAWVVVLVAACSSSGDDTSPDGGGGGGDTATYRAFALFTALDRIAVLRADPETDTCAMVRLVSPANNGGDGFGIATPDGWGIDAAGVSGSSADCFAETFAAPAVDSPGGDGEVDFDIPAGASYPTSLSIDASIWFDTGGAPPFVPARIELIAADLAVE